MAGRGAPAWGVAGHATHVHASWQKPSFYCNCTALNSCVNRPLVVATARRTNIGRRPLLPACSSTCLRIKSPKVELPNVTPDRISAPLILASTGFAALDHSSASSSKPAVKQKRRAASAAAAAARSSGHTDDVSAPQLFASTDSSSNSGSPRGRGTHKARSIAAMRCSPRRLTLSAARSSRSADSAPPETFEANASSPGPAAAAAQPRGSDGRSIGDTTSVSSSSSEPSSSGGGGGGYGGGNMQSGTNNKIANSSSRSRSSKQPVSGQLSSSSSSSGGGGNTRLAQQPPAAAGFGYLGPESDTVWTSDEDYMELYRRPSGTEVLLGSDRPSKESQPSGIQAPTVMTQLPQHLSR